MVAAERIRRSYIQEDRILLPLEEDESTCGDDRQEQAGCQPEHPDRNGSSICLFGFLRAVICMGHVRFRISGVLPKGLPARDGSRPIFYQKIKRRKEQDHPGGTFRERVRIQPPGMVLVLPFNLSRRWSISSSQCLRT